MRKNAFNTTLSIQTDILKRSQAMRETNILRDKCSDVDTMYDNRKDVVVNLKDVPISTVKRLLLFLNKLKKYNTDESVLSFIRKKEAECNNNIRLKEQAEIDAKRAASREYWAKKNKEFADKMKIDGRNIRFILDESEGLCDNFNYIDIFNLIPPIRFAGTEEDWLKTIYDTILDLADQIAVGRYSDYKISVLCSDKTSDEVIKDVKWRSDKYRRITINEKPIEYNVADITYKNKSIEMLNVKNMLTNRIYVIVLPFNDKEKISYIDNSGCISLTYNF